MKIADATKFKSHYSLLDGGKIVVKQKEFNSIKSMWQWLDRNDYFSFIEHKRMALVSGEWQPFVSIGKKTLLLSELKKIVKELEDNRYLDAYEIEDVKPSKLEK